MIERMTTVVTKERLETKAPQGADAASTFAAALMRRRAAFRLYSVLLVLAFGAILNAILWITGHASQYQMLPEILALAAFVYGAQWLADRTR